MNTTLIALTTWVLLLLLEGCSAQRITQESSCWLGNAAVFRVYARGYYVYVSSPCRNGGNGPRWIPVAVVADLYDMNGNLVGRQVSFDTWEGLDYSRVTGRKMAVMASPSVPAIPWISYEARSSATPGLFANVNRVRRIYTWGGKAPRGPCPALNDRTEVRVPFGAVYFFDRGVGAEAGVGPERTIADSPVEPRAGTLRRLDLARG